MQSVCVFCGSADGVDRQHQQFAHDTGRLIADFGMRLVYGGGDLGLMGLVASACEEAGGQVVGVIPAFLHKSEILRGRDKNHIVTDDMHSRKMRMFEMSDIFLALPGGVGTLEELMEVITLKQLGQLSQPIVMANIGGFWNPLIELIRHMREEGYVYAAYEIEFSVVETADELSAMLAKLPSG